MSETRRRFVPEIVHLKRLGAGASFARVEAEHALQQSDQVMAGCGEDAFLKIIECWNLSILKF
jgi:hypothetical protein